MKWVPTGRSEQQQTRQQQARCNLQCEWVVAQFHIRCAIVARTDYMHVAMIHDWLNGMRGGERVLEALLEVFPNATIYTLLHERGKTSPSIESRRIVTSWLDRIPSVYRFYRNLLPLFPLAVKSFDLSEFDVVISSSHAVAKGVRAPHAIHICYCHTPMRYIWDAENDYAFDPIRRLAMACLR